SVPSWNPSSICAPAQAWHVPSVGSCWPREITHGQNTVQLHESTKSPLIFHSSLSATRCSPSYDFIGQCAATDVAMNAIPINTKATPSVRLKRVVVLIFSIAIMAPSAAIQITFITPTPNIESIIAQQQPRQ